MSRGNGIKPLSDLFAKYKKLKPPQAHVVETFVEVVSDVLGVNIQPTKVRYAPHNKTLHVSTAGPIKSEITLHKQELLTHLKGRLGAEHAPSEIL